MEDELDVQAAMRVEQEKMQIAMQQSGLPGCPTEHQTARDIRQWAICEAGRHETVPDQIMKLADRFVAFVEHAQ